MLKFPLTNDQRKMFGEKFLDLAHLILGGLVIGQSFSGKEFSKPFAVLGVGLLVFFYWLSYTLTKKGKK